MPGFCRVDYYFFKCLVFVEWIFIKAGHPHILVKWLFASPKPWNCGWWGCWGLRPVLGCSGRKAATGMAQRALQIVSDDSVHNQP